MNDNDIVKALEHCSENGECKDCLANPHRGNYGYCASGLMKRAIDLINRQKAEIDELKAKLSHSIGVDNTNQYGCYPFD